MIIPDWSSAFSVGHPLLDSQHQKLLALCSHAAECVEDHSLEGTEYFHHLLNELSVYASQHFMTEEQILIQHNYPHLHDHQAMHDQYETRLGDFFFEAMSGNANRAGVHEFLAEWWTHHILISDMGYRDFLKTASQES